MCDPELYAKGNSVQRQDAEELLLKYGHLVQWQKSAKDIILDVGCADGDVTWQVLRPLLPSGARLLGVDINPKMLEFAARKYPDFNTLLLDICTPQLPHHLLRAFNHVFSFYCLHWAVNQRQAMQNIFDMLKPGGSFLACYLGSHSFYDAFMSTSKAKKFNNYAIDLTTVLRMYGDEEDIEAILKNIITDVGFNITICEVTKKHIQYSNFEELKSDITAIYPNYIKIHDENKKTEFLENIIEDLLEQESVIQYETCAFLTPYKLISILATKPAIH